MASYGGQYSSPYNNQNQQTQGGSAYASQGYGPAPTRYGGPGGGGYGQQGRFREDEYAEYNPQPAQQIAPYPSSQPQRTQQQQQGPSILTNPDFLARVDACKRDIDTLSSNVSAIANAHQRAITAPDTSSSTAMLENMVTQTQVLNTRIRDQIKFLQTDAARSGGNATKDSQVRNLQNQFRNRLEQYQQEEVQYKKRYQEQIARQYRIVNPAASEEEVREAVSADWGDEGVFQTALRSNRSGHATSALGMVRSRHNDIQRIEKTLLELNQLFQDLAESIQLQDPLIQQTEQQTERVKADTEAANVQIDKGIKHARRARCLKWTLCVIVSILIIAIVVVLVIYFKVIRPDNNNNKQPAPATVTQSAATPTAMAEKTAVMAVIAVRAMT